MREATVLLERATETRLVEEAMAAAATGAGSLLTVTGPLGIGRTALLDSLAARAADAGVRVLHGSGAPAERGFAHGLLKQVFDPLLVRVPEEVRAQWFSGPAAAAEPLFATEPTCTGAPPRLPAESAAGSSTGTRQAVLNGLWALMAEIGREQPLLLLVDDLHWADTASLNWLGHLVKHPDGLPVTVVATVPDGHPCTRRTQVREITGVAACRLPLRPLSPAGTAAAVRQVFGSAGEPEFVRACHETSGGNPLLLIPVLLHMAADGRLPLAAQASAVPAQRPPLLRDRLVQHVLWQPESLRACGNAVVVLGEDADVELIEPLSRLDGVACTDALRALDQQGLLSSVRPPLFARPVVREAFEESVSDPEREHLHRRAASLLVAHGRAPERVAGHLLLTSATLSSSQIGELHKAADAALARGAAPTAARYLRRALLDTPAAGPRRAALLGELALAEARFAPVAAERHLRQAVAQLDNAHERAAALMRFSPSPWWIAVSPTLTEVVRQLTDELADAPEAPLDPSVPSNGTHDLPMWLESRVRMQGQGPAHIGACVERLRELGPDVAVNTWVQRDLASVLLHVVAMSGRLPRNEVMALAQRILERDPLFAVQGHSSAPLLASAILIAGGADGLLPCLDSALRHAEDLNDVVGQIVVRGFQACVALTRGELGQARIQADESLALAGPQHGSAVFAVAALAAVALESRDTRLADRLLGEYPQLSGFDDAPAAAQPMSSYGFGPMLRGMRADSVGDHASALELFLECGRSVERSGRHLVGLCLTWRLRAARQQILLGNTGAAAELIEEEHTLAVAWGVPVFIGRALRMQAVMSTGDRALELAEASVDVLREAGNRLELAKTAVLLGRRLRAAGDHQQAEVHLRRGHDLAAGCAASWLVARAAMELRTLPGGRSPAARRPLTSAQRTVAEQASLGLTNRAIAESLGVTSRAVEKHLTSAYRKLGVATRADLPAALGLLDGDTAPLPNRPPPYPLRTPEP